MHLLLYHVAYYGLGGPFSSGKVKRPMVKTLHKTRSMTSHFSGAAARVHTALKHEFLTGRIPPGAVLHEVEIAARFSVSKSPVRDALSLLRAEGYIQAIPHRGYVASDVSLRDFSEVFHLRKILEGEAAALAAERATVEEVRHLKGLVERGQQAEVAKAFTSYVSANRTFHLNLAELGGNVLLRKLIEQLLDRAERAIALGVKTRPRLDEVYEETLRIITAVEHHDPEGARRAMAAHIENMRRRLLSLEGGG